MTHSLDTELRPEATPDQPIKKARGFAAMDSEQQKHIASLGGRAAHERGRAHEFTTEKAREAGRKGGQAVSQDRAHMSQIGALGGRARARRWTARDGSDRSVVLPAPEDSTHG